MRIVESALLLAVASLLAGPAKAQPAPQHFACTYYDFNREVQYSSNVFAGSGDNGDANAYLGDFSAAIHAQFHIPVEMKHVECHTVGEWRVDAERDRLSQLAAARDARDRVVAWPRTAT